MVRPTVEQRRCRALAVREGPVLTKVPNAGHYVWMDGHDATFSALRSFYVARGLYAETTSD